MEINEKLLSKKLRQRVKDLESNQIYGTEEGESISVYDSAEGYCKLHKTDENGNPYFDIGNMKQNTTTGDNLIFIGAENSISNGSYVSGANTNQYQVKATGTDMFINNVRNAGQQYAKSVAGNKILCFYGETIYYNTGNASFINNYITEYDSNNVSLGYYNKSVASGSYTPTNSNCAFITFRFGINPAISNRVYTLAPYVTKDLTKINNYESFALPTSNYPQQIECVTGTVNNKIQNGNLLNTSKLPYSNGSVDTRTVLNFQIYLGLENAPHKKVVYQESISQHGLYVANFTPNSNYTKMRVKHSGASMDLYKDFDCVVKENENYTVAIWITGAKPNVVGGFSFNKLMVVKGTYTAQTLPKYILHEKQIKTLHLSDKKLYGKDEVRDYFWKDLSNENWYLKHKYFEQILAQSSNIRLRNTNEKNISTYSLTLNYNVNFNNLDKAMSDYFVNLDNVGGAVDMYNKNVGFAFYKTSTIQTERTLYINSEISTLSEFQNWLVENNVKLVYSLNESIDELITDETLIAELEDMLNNSRTYKNVTHIENDSIAILNLEYVKDFNTIINNLSSAVVALGGEQNV